MNVTSKSKTTIMGMMGPPHAPGMMTVGPKQQEIVQTGNGRSKAMQFMLYYDA
jgi:hypothetical protein